MHYAIANISRTNVPESRFAEVAELIGVCWLEIRGWINTRMLSPATLYAAYLVFKPTAGCFGFDCQPVEVSVGIVGAESHTKIVYLNAERGRRLGHQIIPRRTGILFNNRTCVVGIQAANLTASNMDQQYPMERGDGWLEMELGEYLNGGAGDEDRQLEIGVCEVEGGDWKGGLTLQGIEIRPKLITMPEALQ